MTEKECTRAFIEPNNAVQVIINKGDSKDTKNDRGYWSSHLDFILSLIGSSIGTGNVWRFPYLCYKSGGGAFLIPYFLTLICIGVPIYFLEVALGQRFSCGGLTLWDISPLFKGIGYGVVLLLIYLNTYYIVVVTWSLYYFVMSFSAELPWSNCDNWWNKNTCVSQYDRINLTCHTENSWDSKNETLCEVGNGTEISIRNLTDPVQEFWQHRVLQISPGIGQDSSLQWELVATLLVAWILTYFCLWKGVKVTGKVVYFTALFPYVLMIILLVHGLMLPNAGNGIYYFLYPDFEKLKNISVWNDAMTQVFWTYALGFSVLITLGSYNKIDANCYRASAILGIVNPMTSLLCGFIVFSTLGFMAGEQQKPIEEVAASGPGLAFLVYPTAVLQMPFPQIWTVVFFFTMILVGFDSQFCAVEALVTAFTDQWPKQLSKRKELFVLVLCIAMFIIGLSCVTRDGIYVFELFNSYAASGITLIFFILAECLALQWGYGIDRFWSDIEVILGFTPFIGCKYCWKYVAPIISGLVLLFNIVIWSPPEYNSQEFPAWAHYVGWMMSLSSVVCVPIYGIWIFASTKFKGSFIEKIRFLTKEKSTIRPIEDVMRQFRNESNNLL